jgi:homoserine O-succinyltransferase/O-acetyltransferase
MPVCLSRDSSGRDLVRFTKFPLATEFRGSAVNCIDIGLVNNMPGKALQATERQFLALLDAASQDIVVRLWLYSLPGVPRTGAGRPHSEKFYSSVDQVWSCLAAHAAVLRMDGIARRRLSQKRFGLFECNPTPGHELTAGLASRFVMPHSRWNDLAEDELTACGYSLLTRSEEAGADAFVKQGKSLFLFFQGHPEYEANTLQLEYIRDAGRYLRGESENYPARPQGYFDGASEKALVALEQQALEDRRPELLAEVSKACGATKSAGGAGKWRSPAVRVYRNWLKYLAASKARRVGTERMPRYTEASA